jgi:hypothetical protein
VSGWKLTVRSGPKVKHASFDSLDVALAELESRAHSLALDADAKPFGGGLFKEIQPVQQVVARLELAGPRRVRAGVDVRGDGSAEAYTGRVRRQMVEQVGGESPYAALRRVLEAAP